MVLPELLREIESRDVTLEPAGDRLRFRPKRNLTPELVEGLREHKAAILEALEGGEKPAQNFAPVKPGLNSGQVIESTAEVLALSRAHLGEMAHPEEPPYPPPEKRTDPLVHRHTAKARFFRGVRRRDLENRGREGLPPWIRLVDEGGAA